jgi:hypothetical protein
VTFWKISDYRKKNAETGVIADKDSKSVLLRYYTVFNVLQCENYSFGCGMVSANY